MEVGEARREKIKSMTSSAGTQQRHSRGKLESPITELHGNLILSFNIANLLSIAPS